MKTVVTLEIGSTITKANAFYLADGRFTHIGQGFASTSVKQGDVGLGVAAAIDQMRSSSDVPTSGVETFVNSSAAGGLRMSVHGLTAGMTARAAKEAALGAGAIVVQTTAGSIDSYDVDDLREAQPNIILLAGGVDYGEKDIVVNNARMIARAGLDVPVVYAGNVAVRRRVRGIFADAGIQLMCADNVFPDVDVLHIEPVRALIHEVFNEHITKAPGMTALADISTFDILPTPGAVLLATEIFADALGDALVIDVGGATTDIHSVTDGTLEWTSRTIDPEPRAKRTVEGDLGVYVNAHRIAALTGDTGDEERFQFLRAMPAAEQEVRLTHWLTEHAVEAGIRRHAGSVNDLFTPTGKVQIVRGKDLTAVRWIVGTGGALTRVPGGEEILAGIRLGAGSRLLPPPEASILIDRDYRFSALGTLAQVYHDEVAATFVDWVASTTGKSGAALAIEQTAGEVTE
ncbi:glutamate mutase L [Propionimicrobium sp. PCR01-08-3]|uniref:glutamate mutase L n=1 Tax=Propionimicrobium sp. PCR01-08-3 TaxID=3052086 RepID=UPI00255C7A6A|nr:glutamate mutase L [Propionimicrobium sp. PCR01-08-3]WIY82699.1 glutamate mutase L [Propionimicrobium sp. PCR01-08-3]